MTQKAKEQLPLPNKPKLPFFAYGAFQVGELAYDQLSPFRSNVGQASINGKLFERDGLPLLVLGGNESVSGTLLTFHRDDAVSAYETICQFEPSRCYRWADDQEIFGQPPRNVLVGIEIDKGSPIEIEAKHWSFRNDPVFEFGLKEVRNVLDEEDLESSLAHGYPRFFRLQMAYLLLWSAVERFSTFAYGPTMNPSQKNTCLSKDRRFRAALRSTMRLGTSEVASTDNPAATFRRSKNDSFSTMKYYYQIRNNLSHQGKGAFLDTERVYEALEELLGLFECVLKHAKNGASR